MSRPAPRPSVLRRVARDPRVSSRAFAGRRFRFPSAAGFAKAVTGRHAARLGFGSLLEMILRRAARLELRRTMVHSPVNVQVSPMFTVNLVQARPIQLAAPRIAHLVKNEIHPFVMPEQRIERTFVERLIAREVRRESRTFASAAPSELHGRSPQSTPLRRGADVESAPDIFVPRVFRRAARATIPEPAPRAASSRSDFSDRSDILPRPSSRSIAPRPAAPVSPHELGRITDHVIDTIDRRITASRERRGMA